MKKQMRYERPKLVDLTSKDWENPFRVGYGQPYSGFTQDGDCSYGGYPSTSYCYIGGQGSPKSSEQ